MGANGFKGVEAGNALGDAIALNTVLKELDISGGQYRNQKCDAAFIKGFSPGLSANGALRSLNISDNYLGEYYTAIFNPTPEGLQAVAAALPACK